MGNLFSNKTSLSLCIDQASSVVPSFSHLFSVSDYLAHRVVEGPESSPIHTHTHTPPDNLEFSVSLMCVSFFCTWREPMHTGRTMNTEKLGVRLQVPTFLLKSQSSQVWLKCDSSVYSEEKSRDYTQLWHLFTFGRYLWRYLHLVVFAPLLPVPPLFFWQGRRHADQTGDRLPGAGLKTDVGGVGTR